MSSSLSALKTRLFCPHRSVQLPSLHSLLALLNDDPTSDDLCNLLWSCITSPNYVLSSSALSGLALLVMSGKYRAEVTIDRLLTSALDLNTEQKLQDFVICVGKMLESQSRTSSKPADCLWGVEKNPHPFITITQRFPASWTVILNFFCEEMITNTSDGHSLRSLQMMAPFLRYTFCEPNIAAKSLPSSPQPKYFSRLLLSFLEVLIDAASDNSELFSYILKFTMSISLDLAMPIDGEFDSDKAIIFERVMNFVADFSAFDDDSKLACELSEDYASMLLSRLCELKAFNKDLTSFLRLLGDFHHQMSFPHIFSVLSYLLIDIPNPTAESSYYILRMMDVLLAGDETIIMSFWPIAELAVLPLTQILAEATSNRLLSAAASILTRLQSLRQRFLQQNLLAETRIPSPSGNSRLYNGVLGDILHRVSLLLQQYTNTEVSPEVPCDASDLLFLSPFIFHPSQTVQNLTFDSLCHIGNSLIKSHGLSLLFLIQYHLRSLNNPVCCLSVVPHLTSTYDPVITSKVLTTFTPMIHRKSVLSSYAVKLVVDVWNKNPRVYFQLKEIIGLYLKDARSVHNRRKDAPKYEVDTEIAVASAIRSILKTKSAENIQDMIPLIHSFLQLDNLHEVTISILLDSINHAIKSLTIDIRAAWNVLVSFVAKDIFDRIKLGSIVENLTCRLCDFFELVPLFADDSDDYIEFQRMIIDSYLYPLLPFEAPASTDNEMSENTHPKLFQFRKLNDKIHSVALMALSKFPLSSASHITPFPRQFVPCIFDIISKLQPGSTLRIAWTKIIAWLVSNEVEKMGRSLMKGGKERINDTTENVNAGNLDKMLQGIKRWVSEVGAGNFGLGIRSALSAVQLVFFIKSAVVETLSSSLVSSFNDATFTDHLLTRFFAIPFYTCHFENVIFNILSANSQLSREALQSVDSEAVQEILLPVFESLLSQLKRSSLVPNAKSNILSCLTGFGLAAHYLGLQAASYYSDTVLRLILESYACDISDNNLPRKENDTVKDAADLDNDEIQCTVALCLAYLVRFTKDEKIVKRIVDLLIEGWKSPGRDWYNFGAGFALCVIYYHKHSSRSTAVPTYIVKLSHAIHSAFTTTKQTLQPKSYLAIAVGLAYSFSFSTSTDTSEYQQTITNAYSNLETFTETSIFESKKGIIVSASAWIVAADAGNDMKSESEISYSIEVLRKVLNKCLSIPEFQSNIFNVMVPFSRLVHLQFLRNPSKYKESYKRAINEHINDLFSANILSVKKLNVLLSLGALIGINYLHPLNSTVAHFADYDYEDIVMPVVECLKNLTGIPGTLTAGVTAGAGTKVAKIALLLLSWICTMSDEEGVGSNMDPRTSRADGKEPDNLNRLSTESSYLRNLFDHLKNPSASGLKSGSQIVDFVLAALSMVNEPLPCVDFYPILEAFSPQFPVTTFRFASARSSSSHSSMDFLLSMVVFPTSELMWPLIVSFDGIGKVLELGGLKRRGVEVKGKRGRKGAIVTIVEDKVVEVVESLSERILSDVKNLSSVISDNLQVEYLLTLSRYLGVLEERSPLQSKLINLLANYFTANAYSPDIIRLFVLCGIPVPVIPRLQTANQVPDNGSAEARKIILSNLCAIQVSPLKHVSNLSITLIPVLSYYLAIRDEFTEASQEEIKLALVETVLVMSEQTFLPPNDVSRLSKSELHDRNQGLRNRFIGSLTLAILDCVIIVSNQREKTESDKNLKRKAESVRCGLEIVVNVLDIWKRGIGEATSDLNQNRGGIDDLQLGLKSSIDNTLFELSRLPYLFQLFVHESTRSEEMLARSEKDGVVWTNPAELQSSFEQILKRMIVIYRNLSGKNDDARLYESCVCLRDCLARFRYWRVVVEEWVLLFGTE